jgi:hypothetical protein
MGRQTAQFMDREKHLSGSGGQHLIGAGGHGIRMIPGNFIAHEKSLAHNSMQKMREQMNRQNATI